MAPGTFGKLSPIQLSGLVARECAMRAAVRASQPCMQTHARAPYVQTRVQPCAQPGVQPCVQTCVQTRVRPCVQACMQTRVQL